MPWQQYAVDVALEYDAETGELWYEEVDLTVPRQSGKTTLILALLVWRAITMARRLGPQTSTYLAQSGKMARKKLEREFAPILRRSRSLHETPHSRARPVKPNDWKLSMNNGSEHILFGTGSYLQIEAPTDKGSHGDVLDMPVIDEAFAHEGDAVEQAVDAASVTRTSPQLYVVSTAGNGKSWYLWRKVRAGRKSTTAGDESKVCYLEWSLPDDASFDDEEAWSRHLPALGHTISIERLRAKLEKALRNELDEGDEDDDPGIDGFRRGYLNQWAEIPVEAGQHRDAKLDAVVWASRETTSRPGGELTLSYDVSFDTEWSSIVLGAGDQTAPYVEQLEQKRGVGWLPDRIVELVRRHNPSRLACVGRGPAGAQVGPIMLALDRAKLDVKLEQLGAEVFRHACGAFFTDVKEGRLSWFAGSVDLDEAARDAAARAIGDAWEWDIRNATIPICALRAATVARALLPVERVKEAPKKARVYSF